MEKMTFREAQLMVIGANVKHGRKPDRVVFEGLQIIPVGDTAEIVEACLDGPYVVLRMGGEGGVESYVPIDILSDKIVDKCIDLLREVAFAEDASPVNKK